MITGVIKNKVTTFKLVDENIKGIVWKINHFQICNYYYIHISLLYKS